MRIVNWQLGVYTIVQEFVCVCVSLFFIYIRLNFNSKAKLVKLMLVGVCVHSFPYNHSQQIWQERWKQVKYCYLCSIKLFRRTKSALSYTQAKSLAANLRCTPLFHHLFFLCLGKQFHFLNEMLEGSNATPDYTFTYTSSSSSSSSSSLKDDFHVVKAFVVVIARWMPCSHIQTYKFSLHFL